VFCPEAAKDKLTHYPNMFEELMDFVRFPSVSAQPQHAADVRRCAEWLAGRLHGLGLEHVAVIPTPRHPIVLAEWLKALGKPVLLVYGHYDVQPADPLGEWRSPPFDRQIRGENLYGRGASDDKGQLFTHVKALEWYLRTHRRLPLNVQCLFEGEEEIGSPNLPAFLAAHGKELAADAAVVSDTRIPGADRPAITEALRGSVSFEIEVRGQKRDLHSGNFGGCVPNPLRILCSMIDGLHDESGRIAVPGFYLGVRLPTAGERRYMAMAGPTDEQILNDAKAEAFWGEPGYSLYERTTIRPAVEITGLAGGYQGAGVKAVIPARALAKINVRLVPDQDPGDIDRFFRRHLSQVTPAGVKCIVRTHGPSASAVVDRDNPAIRAAAAAYQKAFGVLPVFLRSGGTIPVVSLFRERLRLPTVLMGFALPDDGAHAPNEEFHLPTFARGIQTSIHFMAELGASK
jgi:acetylornithine deacetylase/succinyl-diaminopimelate desuccinylase-like protein